MIRILSDHSESARRSVVTFTTSGNPRFGDFLSTAQESSALLAQTDDHRGFAIVKAGDLGDDEIVDGATTAKEQRKQDEQAREEPLHGTEND